ncbi:MAG: EthD family reductase [Clostridia bacterium]
MAAVLYALYRRPADAAAFLEHYRTIHAPLVAAMPGLEEFHHAPVPQTILGKGEWFYLARMCFADRDALSQALSSPEGSVAARDLARFARDVVELFVVEED